MNQKDRQAEPVYFMDLVVENVRCFKEQQVLDLSDGNGKPAQWTIILGDNGTGKTTLLKCLAGFSVNEIKKPRVWDSYVFEEFFHSAYLLALNNIYRKGEVIKVNYTINGYSNSISLSMRFPTDFEMNLMVMGYGAGRKKGKGSLTESKNEDPLGSLFKDTNLINAEAWLLETDFAIKNAKGDTKKYLQNHYRKVKDTLKKLLPDIEAFRIKEITKTQRQASLEVKTPYGWVDMKNLSLGYQTFIINSDFNPNFLSPHNQ